MRHPRSLNHLHRHHHDLCRHHLAPPRADYEQVFAGANFNTEKISGAHVEVSGAHFKALEIIKVSGAPLEASLKSPEQNLMK